MVSAEIGLLGSAALAEVCALRVLVFQFAYATNILRLKCVQKLTGSKLSLPQRTRAETLKK